MNKLNKYSETSNLKKQLSGMLINEISGRSIFLTPGTQSHRKSSDDVTQRLEGSTRNGVLKKRVRTSVVEIQAEGRGSTFGRPAMFVGKNVLDDNVDDSGVVEGKIRKLPAGGEGWNGKIKRKRSVGTVLARISDGDGGTKRVLRHKQPLLETSDEQVFRSGSVRNGGLKLAGSSLPRSVARVLPENESEKVSPKNFIPGFSEEKLIAKGNRVKVNEDSHVMNSGSTKLRGIRAPRNSHIMAANPSSNSPRSSGALEDRKQPSNANRPESVSGVNHYKGLFPSGPSSSMTQWVGQRPQKKSRIRRTNLVCPISNQEELQMPSEGRSAADLGSKLTSAGTSLPSLDKGVTYSPPKLKITAENVPSPARLCDSEEYKAGEDHENGLKEKAKTNGEVEDMCTNSVQTVSPSLPLTKRKVISNKSSSVDGIPRQGRSSRTSSFSRVTTSASRETWASPVCTMPIRIPESTPDKNKSKSGRSLMKKPSGRKVDRFQQTILDGSLDFTGEQVDCEELLEAANSARDASYIACSSPFFKKMEEVFSSLSLDDMYYLKQQLKSSAELPESKSQMVTSNTYGSGRPAQREYRSSGSLVLRDGDQKQRDKKEVNKTTSVVDQIQDSVQGSMVTPLYQRVLSALIVEDEMEGCEEGSSARHYSLQYYSDNSACAASPSAMNGYHCNGSTSSKRGTNIQHQLHKDDAPQGHNGLMESRITILPETLVNGVDRSVYGQNRAPSSNVLHDFEYENMCLEERLLLELQSVDLCPENVPELADGEDEAINQEIIELQKEINRQAGKKTPYLNKIIEEFQKWKESEEGALEQIALDRLVELAHQKKLATNGRTAARLGLPKVPKEVSAGFTKRTLARCRKYEETGRSDFTEPALRDVLLAPPPRIDEADTMHCLGSRNPDISEEDFAKTGPISNMGQQKEVLLDNVGGNSSLQAASSLQNSSYDGAKGKRSVRERSQVASRNFVMKAGRSGRRTKSKPKQKSAQIPSSNSGFGNSETIHPVYNSGSDCNNATNKNRDVKEPLEQPNTELHKSDPIGDLGVVDGLDGNQDFDTILNDVCLEDEDWDGMPYDIPMDDLSNVLPMF